MKLENVKGTRDFSPEEKILRDKIITRLKAIFERYGYNPLETPALENWDLLTAKAGTDENTDTFNEMYRLTDQGGRKLGLRFELTLSLARYIAMNPNIKMPFKRYEIGNVYRDGPIKLGRYREFMQCDIDVIGCKDMMADAECVLLVLDAFRELNLEAYLELNNRKVLFGIMTFADVPESKHEAAIICIDKLKKLGRDGVQEELEKLGIEESSIAKVMSALAVSGTNQEKLTLLKGLMSSEEGKQGLREVEEVLSLVNNDAVIFTPSLARGLSYYTGTVFEGFLKKSEITGSICGGGRYDKMIGMLSGKDIPAVGIAFGLEPLTEAMKLTTAQQKSMVQVYVIPIKNFPEALAIAQDLRCAGIPTDIDLVGRGPSKNLEYANALSIPYVVIAGPDELKDGKVKLKNMQTGEEKLVTKNNLLLELKE